MTYKNCLCVYLLAICVVVNSAFGATALNELGSPEKIVLSVGDIDISEYILTREYGKFRQQKRVSPTENLSREDTEAWLDELQSKLLFVNQAIEKGYLDDERVLSPVRIMSEHMLINDSSRGFIKEVVFGGVDSEIGMQEQRTLHLEWKKSVMDEADFVIEESVLTELQSILKEFDKQTEVYEIERFSGIEDSMIYFCNQLGKVLVSDYVDYLNTTIYRNSYPTTEVVRQSLTTMLVNRVALKISQENGYDKNSAFLAEKNFYTYNVVYENYIKDEVESGLSVDPIELNARYGDSGDRFIGDESVMVFRFSESKWDVAMKSQSQLSHRIRTEGVEVVKNSLASQFDAVDLSDCNEDASLNRELKMTPIGHLSRPVKKGEEFVYYMKVEANGRSQLSFEEVREILEGEIKEEIKKQEIARRQESLNQLYAYNNAMDIDSLLASRHNPYRR